VWGVWQESREPIARLAKTELDVDRAQIEVG
jgi:hypothetical protein